MRAVGHAWSVKVWDYSNDPEYFYYQDWFGGTLYNYGLEPPHYPVPALHYDLTPYKQLRCDGRLNFSTVDMIGYLQGAWTKWTKARISHQFK